MQSRLPDINTAFIKHRNNSIQALASQKWDTVFGSLYAWNGLLPRILKDDGVTPKYRITISDIEYEKVTEIKSMMICGGCEKMTDYSQVRTFELVNPLIVQTITKTKTTRIWVCGHCKIDNKLTQTNIAETTQQEPVYLGVVPKPPRRKDGLHDRGKYARKVTKWAWQMISELEERTGQFREDYKENKGDVESWEEENQDGHLETKDEG